MKSPISLRLDPVRAAKPAPRPLCPLGSNRGESPAAPLEVVGELLGERSEARLAGGGAPAGKGAVVLALGANPGPAVRLAAPALHLDVKGDLAVRLES